MRDDEGVEKLLTLLTCVSIAQLTAGQVHGMDAAAAAELYKSLVVVYPHLRDDKIEQHLRSISPGGRA